MTKTREIYRCSVCGNMVEVLDAAAGTMVCCGKPMTLLEGNTQDASHEKHVPVIERTEGGFIVKVGAAEHPMLAEHYIQWIELHTATEVLRRELHPGEKPEAFFTTSQTPLMVRAYCNLHGLWILEVV